MFNMDRDVESGKQTRLIPAGLEYFPDSPEFITQTVDLTGFRGQIDKAFKDAIERAADPGS